MRTHARPSGDAAIGHKPPPSVLSFNLPPPPRSASTRPSPFSFLTFPPCSFRLPPQLLPPDPSLSWFSSSVMCLAPRPPCLRASAKATLTFRAPSTAAGQAPASRMGSLLAAVPSPPTRARDIRQPRSAVWRAGSRPRRRATLTRQQLCKRRNDGGRGVADGGVPRR